MKTQIFKTYQDFINRKDKKINGVSVVFSEDNPDFIEQNKTNKGCWNCSGCYDCSDCSGCYDCYDKKISIKHVVVEGLNKKVLEAVDNNSLDMSDWHTCETTHCWAGWIVHLAGEEGYALENKTSPCFAAMQIFKASNKSSINPSYFFLGDKEAMVKIKEMADTE